MSKKLRLILDHQQLKLARVSLGNDNPPLESSHFESDHSKTRLGLAIIYAGKNIENRSWPTHFRGAVAIHASKNLSRKEYEESKHLFPRRWRNKLPAYEDLPRGVIIGVAEIVDCVTESKSSWFLGDYGFVLKNRRQVKPIPCAGALGLWNLPPEIERKIKRAI